MICSKCGYLYVDSEEKCPQCGNPSPSVGQKTEENLTPLATSSFALQKLVDAFRDPLFLTLCILTTVSALRIEVFSILFAVFAWLIYSKAQQNTCDIKSMRAVSGTIFSEYVLNWVAVGILAVVAMLLIAAGGLSADLSRIILQNIPRDEDVYELVYSIIRTISKLDVVVIAFAVVSVFGILIAAIIALNLLIYKPMHDFVMYLYQGAYTNKLVLNRISYVANAVLVLGILRGIYSLSFVGSFQILTNGSSAASLIILYIWLKKHFVELKKTNI